MKKYFWEIPYTSEFFKSARRITRNVHPKNSAEISLLKLRETYTRGIPLKIHSWNSAENPPDVLPEGDVLVVAEHSHILYHVVF